MFATQELGSFGWFVVFVMKSYCQHIVQALSFENACCATKCAVCVHFVSVYNITKFSCAENHTPQDYIRCVMVCYCTPMPQKDWPDCITKHELRLSNTLQNMS